MFAGGLALRLLRFFTLLENMIIDHAHYLAEFLWVGGNLAWAAGELWTSEDDPIDLTLKPSVASARFFSSWLLVAAYLPLVVLCVTLMNLTQAVYLSTETRFCFRSNMSAQACPFTGGLESPKCVSP